jgi:shikimate dehydrogenase
MHYYGLIGFPLQQSFSQIYFQQKFASENIMDTTYLNFPIQNIGLFPELLANNPEIKGLNITIPYKEKILQYAHKVNDVVQKCGATNCLKITNGIITAYNTDVIGFEKSLSPLLKSNHDHALVLGTGGAAKAVAYVLNKLQINFLFVSRNANNAATIPYRMMDETLLKKYQLIINATPVGMDPDPSGFPDIPYAFLGASHLLYDLIYNPAETVFLQKGKAVGAAVKNGFEMLELQAEAAWQIWNNPQDF